MKASELVERYVALRDRKAAIKAEYDKKVAAIEDALGKIEIDAYMLWVAYADQQGALWDSEVSRDVPPAAAVGINPRVRDAIRERIHPVTLSGPKFKAEVRT